MNTIRLFLAAASLGLATAATGQNLLSGYFTDGYLFRHQLNPAIGNDQGYFSMPTAGNLNVGFTGNLRTDALFYNVNGRTALFLNPQVSTEEFLSNIHDENNLSQQLRLQLFGFGFKGMGGYNTFEVNMRMSSGFEIPGDLFRLAKEGLENRTYDLGGMAVNFNAYGEFALGHSHQINDHLRIGAKLKFLVGIANVDAKFNKAQFQLGEDAWRGVTNAEVNVNIGGITFEMEEKERGPEDDRTEHTYVNGVDDAEFGIAGYGMAVDLGAVYKLNDDWAFSAAITDLGYINWKNNYTVSTNGDHSISTDRYIFNIDEDASNSFDNELDRLTEGLASLFEMQDRGDLGSRSKMLSATMNLGVEYTPAFYRKMSFGLLNSTRFDGSYSFTDFRLSTNVAPCKFFSASVNLGAGSYGTSFGWLLNLHPNGINLFVGMDQTFFDVTKQFVPLNGKAHINVGLNFPFGGK